MWMCQFWHIHFNNYPIMKIGIIVAMDKELALLLPLLSGRRSEYIGSTELSVGRIGTHEVAAMKCGIGKVNAAIRTQALIDSFAPELVINTGVAGGTGGGAGVLDVVVGDRVVYHDVWMPPYEWGRADGCPVAFTPPEWLLELPCMADFCHGLIASGDIFVASVDVLDAIRAKYPDVMAVDMESAAIAHVCHLNNVAFISLRVVSDTPGADDNLSQYDDFWTKAPESTFNALSNMLKQIL